MTVRRRTRHAAARQAEQDAIAARSHADPPRSRQEPASPDRDPTTAAGRTSRPRGVLQPIPLVLGGGADTE